MIVDASIVFKWLADEEGSDQALALISRERLYAPTLLLSEIGNALWKKGRREQIDPNVSFENELVRIMAVISILDERHCIARAMAMSRVLDHPLYDCVYLAMAEMEARMLITADRRFFNRVKGSEWDRLVESLP